MNRITSLLIATSLLVGCGGDDDKKDFKISEDSYAVQMVASDYSSSQVAVGNNIGDRSAKQNLMIQDKSNFTISAYKDVLYHIGKTNIDTLDKYNAQSSLQSSGWSISVNDDGEGSANTYSLVQQSDTNAYLIRYGSTSIMQINPSTGAIKDYIDLSSYTFTGAEFPRMVDAKIVENKLFVALQRLGANWSKEQAYVAVIDLVTNQEIDTNPQQDGFKGIPLTGTNPYSLQANNGTIYVASRGDYDHTTGALDKINTTTYEVTTLIDNSSFPNLINFSDDDDTSNDTYYHVLDVAVVDDQLAYALLNIEQGYTTLETKVATINPTSGALSLLTGITELASKEIKDINIDANDRLWLGIANADAPGIYVLDTDTNTINGGFIELEMPATRIEFLTID